MSGNILSLNELLKPQQNEIINSKPIKPQDNAKTLDSFHNNHIHKLRQEGSTLHDLKDTLKQDRAFILASGGGTPCFNDNMDLINAEAISVYLDVPLGSISSRLQTSKAQQRPLFQGLDQGELTLKLKSLLVSREYFYNQSKIKLSGEDFSAELLLVELISRLKN